MSLQPTTPEDVQEIVRTHQALLPVGGGTKPALSTAANGETRLEMGDLSGIIEYEPDEYTFTAYAGTPVSHVVEALAEHGQYIPFDPLLVKQGATLGGVVAANTAGSGRYRYGGVRDFILGVHFVDGQGQIVLGGGKVVKNSAGFDLPKFMVGSLGRFGIFTDLTFKVFPQPRSYVTLQVIYPNLEAALQATFQLASTSFEMDVLDMEAVGDAQFALLIRMGGLAEALPGRTERLQAFLTAKTGAIATEVIQDQAEAGLWAGLNAMNWVSEGQNLIKVPIPPKRIPELEMALSGASRRYSVGGNVAWLVVTDISELDAVLNRLDLAGLVLFGPPGRPYVGVRKGLSLAQRVKRALDPNGKFLAV